MYAVSTLGHRSFASGDCTGSARRSANTKPRLHRLARSVLRRALALFLLVGVACGRDAPPGPSVALTVVYDAAAATLDMSHSPNDAAANRVASHTLQAIPFPRALSDTLLHVADVAALRDGRIAILDRSRKQVFVLDSTRALRRVLGRKGDGPGEFQEPLAVAAAGDNLVVLDMDPNKAFTVFGPDGSVVGTTRRALTGDWFASYWRQPDLGLEKPFQSGPEDWPRRLVALGSAAFANRVQDDERAFLMGRAAQAPRAFIVRYALPAFTQDTLWSGPAPLSESVRSTITDKAGRPVQEASPRVLEKIFVDRPVLASGNDWYALRLPSSNVMSLHFANNATLTIKWPRTSRAIQDSDVIGTALHVALDGTRRNEAAADRWDKADSAQREEKVRVIARNLGPWFADSIPDLMTAYGAGDCLWLVGASTRDHVDGTALTLVGVDVRKRGSQPAVVRISRRGSRIRDVTPNGIVTTYKDADDVIRLEWHPFPPSGCQAPASLNPR